jgi:acyl carrier protein
MDKLQIDQTVLAVLRTTLKQQFDGSYDVSRENTPNWDSLKHIEIMFALEEELGVEFTEEELSSLNGFQKIVDTVLQKNAA